MKGWADNMGNLLKLEFTRLKRQKSFYICTIVMAALLCLSALTANALINANPGVAEDFSESGIASLINGLNSSSFTLIAGIFVVLFVCEDYENQMVKNIFARGYSRKSMYFAKMVSVWASTTVMFVVVELVAFVLGTALFGVGEMGDLKFLAVLGTQYVVAMANMALAFGTASVLRRNGGSIAGVILVPMLVNMVLGLADSFLKIENFSLTGLWVPAFLTDISLLTVSTERMLTCLAASLVYIPVFIGIGLYFNKKIEL